MLDITSYISYSALSFPSHLTLSLFFLYTTWFIFFWFPWYPAPWCLTSVLTYWIMKVVGKWMDVETIVLTALTQIQKNKGCKCLFTSGGRFWVFRDMCFSCSALQSQAATKAPWRGIWGKGELTDCRQHERAPQSQGNLACFPLPVSENTAVYSETKIIFVFIQWMTRVGERMRNEAFVREMQCGGDREVRQAPDTAVKVKQVLSFHREPCCSCNTFQMQDGVELLQLSRGITPVLFFK